MNRWAVVIGVDRTGGGLRPLTAAASGARDFANWAQSEGFSVELLTDDGGTPVTLAAVKDAVKAALEGGICERLVIFFAGHGILKAPETELWLLSGAPTDPTEAINVGGSIALGRNSGLRHLVVISDACRSRPNSMEWMQMEGGSVFPNQRPRPRRPAVDVVYASLPGDVAYEASITETEYAGILTRELLTALRGGVSAVVEDFGTDYPKDGIPRYVIPSWKLKDYLEATVPVRAAGINARLIQYPEVRAEARQPEFLGTAPAPSSTTPPTPRLGMNAPVHSARALGLLQEAHGFPAAPILSPPPASDLEIRARGLAEEMDRVTDARGRRSFETRTGFTIVGAQAVRASAGELGAEIFEEDSATHVRVFDLSSGDDRPELLAGGVGRTALIQTDQGWSIPLAVLPGFIGVVVVEQGGVVTVNYTPSAGTRKFHDYQVREQEVERRRAFAAVASRHGAFRLDQREAGDVAAYLRYDKALDPTLGLYAAYAYLQSGEFEKVLSVCRWMEAEPEPVLYDVALLAGIANCQHARTSWPGVAPFCPMLTQGWTYIGRDYPVPPKNLDPGLQRFLIPGLWTTFTPDGADYLFGELDAGRIV